MAHIIKVDRLFDMRQMIAVCFDRQCMQLVFAIAVCKSHDARNRNAIAALLGSFFIQFFKIYAENMMHKISFICPMSHDQYTVTIAAGTQDNAKSQIDPFLDLIQALPAERRKVCLFVAIADLIGMRSKA